MRTDDGLTPDELRTSSGLTPDEVPLARGPARLEVKDQDQEEDQGEQSSSSAEAIRQYEKNIGAITEIIAGQIGDAVDDYGLAWVLDSIEEATTREKRSWKYCMGCLKNWRREGRATPAERAEADAPITITKAEEGDNQW